MFELLVKGGPLMVPIFMCSLIGVAVLIERIWSLHRAQIDRDQFVKGIRNIIKKNKIAEAITICDETQGPVASILKAGLLQYGKDKEDVKEAIENAALYEFPKLKKHLVILYTVTQISPLLGLLGTVMGMINAFIVIHQHGGIVNAGDLAQGIYEALITTVGGLVVAIPCFVAYNYISSRVQKIIFDMEQSAAELLSTLSAVDSEYEIKS